MKAPFVEALKARFCLALAENEYASLKSQRNSTIVHERAVLFEAAFKMVTPEIPESLVCYRRLQQECGIAEEKANGSCKELAGRLSDCWNRLLHQALSDIDSEHIHATVIICDFI